VKPRSQLLLFTKPPRAGRVKTRLIGFLSPQQAADVHRACLADAIRLAESARECQLALVVAGSPRAARALARELRLGRRWRVETQRGRDLGRRMERALADAFRAGARKAVILGTDTPWMNRSRIRGAFAALASADVVLGPSRDGGYFLLGARRIVPQIFRGIAWGTPRVLPLTLRALRKVRIRYRLLREDFDLDTPRDLARAEKMLRRDPSRAPALARCLQELKLVRRSSRRPPPARRSRTPRPVRA
jgi:rSAM/selenodomain-associated transferase 1